MTWRRKQTKGEASSTQGTTARSSVRSVGNISVPNTKSETLSCLRKVSKVRASRYLFILCLCATAAVLGFLAYGMVKESEDRLARESFASMADRALVAAQSIVYRKRKGPETLASIVGQAFPDSNAWPNVHLSGYYTVSNQVIETSSGRSMGLMPLVTPGQLESFETYCYNTAFPQEYPGKVVGESSFGRGVYALNFSNPAEDHRYHDVNATTIFDSPYEVLTPYIDHSMGESILMMNLHSVELFGRPIDDVITCALERSVTNDNECSKLTDILQLTGKQKTTVSGPGAIIIQPVYPAHDPHILVAVISSTIVWEEAFENVFSDQINGVNCILETENQAFTYEIVNGAPILLGEGDLHDGSYTKYGKSANLAGPGMFSNTSSSYKISLYPNEDFFQVYRTKNPLRAVVGSVGIILITCLIFFVHDKFIREAFHNKDVIFNAKRRFVRFVSHEVRTPLNGICMGLRLLLDEMQRYATNAAQKSEQGIPLDTSELQTILAGWSEEGDEVLRNAHNAVGILTDLLHYDRVESGTLKLELSVVEIWPILEDVVAEFKLPAQKKRLTLTLDTSALFTQDQVHAAEQGSKFAGLPGESQQLRIIGDRTRLLEIIRNLVSNAIKFTPDDGHISVRPRLDEGRSKKWERFTLENGNEVVYQSAGRLHLEVEDDGVGMTEDQISQVFGEGIQFSRNVLQAGGGSGLGLYIAKGISVQHRGKLVACSGGIGKGSTFTLTLPVYRGEHEAEDASLSLAHVSFECAKKAGDVENGAACTTDDSNTSNTNLAAKSSFQPLHVLVVDDAKTNRKLLMRLLQREGHTCEDAEDGMIAVEKVRKSMNDQKTFDSILMDYEMPNMNGPTATQAIRAMGCDAMVIGVTGNLFPEDVSYFKESGANSVLGKPLVLRDLLSLWSEYGLIH